MHTWQDSGHEGWDMLWRKYSDVYKYIRYDRCNIWISYCSLQNYVTCQLFVLKSMYWYIVRVCHKKWQGANNRPPTVLIIGLPNVKYYNIMNSTSRSVLGKLSINQSINMTFFAFYRTRKNIVVFTNFFDVTSYNLVDSYQCSGWAYRLYIQCTLQYAPPKLRYPRMELRDNTSRKVANMIITVLRA